MSKHGGGYITPIPPGFTPLVVSNLDNCQHLNCAIFHTNTVTFSESVRDDMPKKFFLSCSKTHFENRRSYRYYKQYCSSRAENWWHISTQKPPNVGSSIAISEPIIAGLVLATGSPNSMKLVNLVQRPTQTG